MSIDVVQVFAPLARLLGLYSVKEELEELAFGYSKPEEYARLRQRLDSLAEEQEPGLQQACSYTPPPLPQRDMQAESHQKEALFCPGPCPLWVDSPAFSHACGIFHS